MKKMSMLRLRCALLSVLLSLSAPLVVRAGEIHGFVEKPDGKIYYFDREGRPKTGWIEQRGNSYYLEYHALAFGWQLIGETGAQDAKWYYFNSRGQLLRNENTPDGFFVDRDGIYAGEARNFAEVRTEAGELPAAEAEEKKKRDEEDRRELQAIEAIYEARQERSRRAGGTQHFSFPDSGVWRGDAQRSGRYVAGMPVEFFMLTIAGETSGGKNNINTVVGDRGRAYGLCQLDYRYDLTDFIRFAYQKDPALWRGLAPYLSCERGDGALVRNQGLVRAFKEAMLTDYSQAVSDQLEFIRNTYWDEFSKTLNAAGFALEQRNIAVSAALLSVNVNCGPQAQLFISALQPELSDVELLEGIYRLRNTVLAEQRVGAARKGTTPRYLSAEPQMAADLYLSRIGINTEHVYGGGVEWHGNPF